MHHALDAILFRGAGFYMWWHASTNKGNDWDLVVAGICAFLMPDVLRGRDSLPARIVATALATFANQVKSDEPSED